MKFSVFQLSRKGGREKNEDRMGYCYTSQSALFLLADGMGGHPDGEVAAQLAVQTLSAHFKREARPQLPEVEGFFQTAILAAHRQIQRYAERQGLSDTPRTTLVAAVVQDGRVHWAHCGDSRLYFVRNGQMIERTRDHSLLEQQNATGAFNAQTITNRNVLYTCLGSPTRPVFDVGGGLPLELGDRILLCSDGLWGNLDEAVLVDTLSAGHVSITAARLVEQALLRGGPTCDNTTLVAVEWETPSEFDATVRAPLMDALDETGFSSTVQSADLDDEGSDADLDDADIERSIAEINAAIRRSSSPKN